MHKRIVRTVMSILKRGLMNIAVDFHILTLIFQDTGMLKPKSVLKILSLKHVQLFIVAHNAVAR